MADKAGTGVPLLPFAYGEGMGMTRVGRGILTAALLCLLTAQGCSGDLTGPSPSLSPTTSAQTPTESAQQRQERLDYAAAEKAYRTFRAEYGRVLRAGGAKEPTRVMKATAGGSYLRELSEIIEAYEGTGAYDRGKERIGYVRAGGYGPNALILDVCEDGRAITTHSGDKLIPGEIRTAHLQITKAAGEWKISSGTGRKVSTCE
jgi:hypothetical protein